MSEDEINRCYLPDMEVSRIGNCVMLKCDSEDDAIVAYEVFRELATVGTPIWIGKSEA